MKLTAIGKWYRRVPIYIKGPNGIVRFPLLLLADGSPGYIINQWNYWLVQQETRASSFEQNVRALEHLYAFNMARHDQRSLSRMERESLVVGFIDAKHHGTDQFCTTDLPHLQYLKTIGLYWQKTPDDTIERYIAAINYFDTWQATFHNAERLNPSERRFMEDWEIYLDFKRRTNTDLLLHLHPANSHEKEGHKIEVESKRKHKRLQSAKPKTAKGFPMGHLLKLFDCARNPRDELLILLMCGGSLRMSEPLHLFRTDIESMSEWGELKVRLEDPITGMVEWRINGEIRHGKRQDYFAEVWKNEHLPLTHSLRNLRSRDSYLDDPLQSGWKGMSFGESDGGNFLGTDPLNRHYDVHYLWWLDPRIGARAQIAYENYRDKCINRNYNTGKPMPEGWLQHPWLFINLTPEDYGMPLTYEALKKIWGRLLDRLAKDFNINLHGRRLGWHSLRHFYGWYCASILKHSLEFTSTLMHHSSKTSTEVYYTLSKITARNEINKKFLESVGYKPDDIDRIIMPETHKLEFPSDWMNRQLYIKLLETDQKLSLIGRT